MLYYHITIDVDFYFFYQHQPLMPYFHITIDVDYTRVYFFFNPASTTDALTSHHHRCPLLFFYPASTADALSSHHRRCWLFFFFTLASTTMPFSHITIDVDLYHIMYDFFFLMCSFFNHRCWFLLQITPCT